MEKTVQQVKVENSMSFTEARKIVEVLRPAATGKTYGAMVKVSTTSVAIQTDLTWSNGEEKKKWLTLKNKIWIPEIHQKVYLGSQAHVNLRR